MKIYIYKHTNKINKKSYIGQTEDLDNIWINNAAQYKTDKKFYKAILKYGWNNFETSLLATVENQEEADKQENYFIDKYNTLLEGYNEPYDHKKSLAKPVCKVNTSNFKILREYKSLGEAAAKNNLSLSTLSRYCNLRNKTIYREMWCFKDDYDKLVYHVKNKRQKDNQTKRGEKEKKSNKKLIAFELTEPLRIRLKTESYNKGITLSALIREILEKHFEER